MKIENTNLPGVLVITPRVFSDPRGFFQESYTQRVFNEIGIKDNFIQDNHSYSEQKGTIRGLHFQKDPMAQSKLIKVIKGSILDIIVDINPKSENFMKSFNLELNDKVGHLLYIPKGYAHGFCTLEDATHVIYKVDNYYSFEHNCGIAWNDEDLKIDWGVKSPILSEQDKKWSTLKNYLKST